MDIYSDYIPQFLLVAGLVVLTIEVAVLGFSTFLLFFVGIGCLLTSALMYLGVLDSSMLTAAIAVGIISAISALALWQPLKRLQSQQETKPVKQDFIGHSFLLSTDIDQNTPGKYRYSGIEWDVYGNTQLSKGTRVSVVALEVGKFFVEAS